MTAADILNDPRWDDDPVELWDEVLRKLGYERAVQVWMQACRECDAIAEAQS